MVKTIKEQFHEFINGTYSYMENEIKGFRKYFDNYGKAYVNMLKRCNTFGKYRFNACLFQKRVSYDAFDILTGLYFPSEFYSSGDIIDVHVGGYSICKITIDSPNRIYKPFSDFYWLYVKSLYYNEVEILTNDRPFYAIGVRIHALFQKYICSVAIEHVSPNGLAMRYISGMGGIGQCDITNPDVIKNMYTSPPYIYAAKLIKKHMRAYHRRVLYERDLMTVYI